MYLMVGPCCFADDLERVAAVVESNCLDCHDSATREAGIDLTQALIPAQVNHEGISERAKLWDKINRVVARGQMPPEDAGVLEGDDRELLLHWYRDRFVLREGKTHIGPSPLRRITRYELGNILSDLLLTEPEGEVEGIHGNVLAKRVNVSKVPSDLPGVSGFSNDATRLQTLRPPLREISAVVHDTLQDLNHDEKRFNAVFGGMLLPISETNDAANQQDLYEVDLLDHLQSFILRACRCGPERANELARFYRDEYRMLGDLTPSPRQRFLRVIEMILISPDFLYRFEQSSGQKEPYPVRPLELATRLSFFLWSTIPDKELMEEAQSGQLLEEQELIRQIQRMLHSPRRLALTEAFAAQWLGFQEILDNDEYLVDEKWNRSAYDEAFFFFDEMIRANRSILDLVDSEWLYISDSKLRANADQYTRIEDGAIEYQYSEVIANKAWEKAVGIRGYRPPVLVRTSDERVGGLLTSPAVMRLTASKNRTSPIRRGVWVLDTLIGRQMEPPADVPPLDEALEQFTAIENPTVLQILSQHVSRSECVSCHKSIDPLGIGLENYSPLGEWRTMYLDKKRVESAGVMPNGINFESPKQMKRLMLELYGDEIATNFVRRLLAYAIGRPLEAFDQITVDKIMRQVRADSYRINTAIEQVVISEPFLCRQDD